MATGTGNLPYTMPPVSPFDVITSQAENERIANIESLADGTGIGDGAVTLGKIGGGSTTGILTTDASGVVTPLGNYSMTEQPTNTTWVDGKMIYKRTINRTFVSGTSSTSVAHGIAGIDTVVDFQCMTGPWKLPMYLNTGFYRSLSVSTTNTSIDQAGGSLPAGTFPITIYYTKV